MSRLEGDSLDVLVDRALDYLLEQPISSMLDTAFVQKQIILSLQTVTQGEQTEVWAKEMLDQLRALAPEEVPKIDKELLEPIEEMLSFPFALDEQICLSLMEHEAIEDLMRAVLTDTIEEFATKIKSVTESATPSNVSKGFGAFRSLRDKALKSTPLGSITQLIEKQIQFKTQEHITKSISSSIVKTAALLSAESNRHQQGAYRLHVLSTILETPVSMILTQVDSFGTDRFVRILSTFLSRLSSNTSFLDGLSTALDHTMELWGDKTLQSLLEESGMGEAWREDTQPLLGSITRGFVRTTAFKDWFQDLLGDE
jgi:hypothetical protein